eukprot:755915-Hanusia_phi.AAC.4
MMIRTKAQTVGEVSPAPRTARVGISSALRSKVLQAGVMSGLQPTPLSGASPESSAGPSPRPQGFSHR